ncbi:MAG: hypothetical protein AMXMBFR4_23820 [Candidatus Hydrogenedentota bacterium]
MDKRLQLRAASPRSTLLRLFSRRAVSDKPDPAAGLLPGAAFEEQLVLERARADRSGSRFALIVFTIQSAQNEEEQARAESALAAALMTRMRICDAKGWYGHRIAALLPYTTKAAAANLIGPIEGLFRRHFAGNGPSVVPGPQLAYTIYEYPDDGRSKVTVKVFRNGEAVPLGGNSARMDHVS